MASQPAVDAASLERERRLIEEAQRGNLDALRPLLDTYAAPLYANVILPRVGEPATAEDVLRDTFLTAVTKIQSFRWQGHGLYGWLRQIAVNKAYDLHRRSQRQRRLAEALAAELAATAPPACGPDALLIARQETAINRRRIAEALARIPDRYRRAIELRLIDELPRDECAATLNVTVGTFDVLLYRAVRAFRRAFGDRDE